MQFKERIDDETMNIIIAYGPCEDKAKEKQDEFCATLTIITENCKGKIIIVDDQNRRVTKEDETTTEILLGKFGETMQNNNR